MKTVLTSKRWIALTVLAIGLLPSIPVFIADAAVPNQADLQRHCRERLGFGPTEPLGGPMLLQLRRCIDNTKAQYEKADRLQARFSNRPAAVHYSVINKELTPDNPRETQRTLNERMLQQEKTRLSYYNTVPVEDREVLLTEHRRSRRLIIQEQEARLIRERRAKLEQWQRSIQICRYYTRDESLNCQWHELTQ